ncbi:MAG TPA: dienelactone hydrolase family protein [Candidatus Binataceae bacterium]|nr:dienelactone hydrolase family protein [Candidatus Binataceae bacterium]
MKNLAARATVTIVALLAVWSIAAPARGKIVSKTITLNAGQIVSHSFLVYDDSLKSRRPGVLVVPEFWGLNDYAKSRAKMLAQLGYVALAVDMYGDGKVTTDPKQAGAWATALETGDRAELRRRINAALDELKRDPRVDSAKTAAIGYCFGGTTVLELARSGADLQSVVSFHGHPGTGAVAQPGAIRARILLCAGADDPYVPPAQLEAFEQEMRTAGANWEIDIYSGAKHSFTNPGADQYHVPALAYNRDADQRSWAAMRELFDETLQ